MLSRVISSRLWPAVKPRDMQTQTTFTSGLQEDVIQRLRRSVPGLTILAHPDPGRIGEEVALTRLDAGERVTLSRLEPAFGAPAREKGTGLNDPHLSRRPLFLLPGPEPGGVRLDDSATRTRVSVYLRGAQVSEVRIFSAADVDRGAILVLSGRVALLLHRVDPVPTDLPRFGLVGDSVQMARVRREIRSATDLEVPVLLRGETGTGKELVARALHDAGKRQGPYVTVNMAALPPTLAAAELFGAARGAYTGADRRRRGYFQRARGGTLFLDEIGAAPTEVQALLLRALEDREIRPVGSTESIPIDVRLIAATDAELETEIQEGRFRAPLLHRLAGYEIAIPTLRQRRDDVVRLMHHFLHQELDAFGTPLPKPGRGPWPPPALVARLVDYDWPGNVRQLRNIARRLAIAHRDALADDELASLVGELLRDGQTAQRTPESAQPSRPLRRSTEVSDEDLLEALEGQGWEIRPAARVLRVSPSTLYRLIDRCPRIRKAVELEQIEIEEALSACAGDRDAAARRLRVSPQGLRRRMTQLGLD